MGSHAAQVDQRPGALAPQHGRARSVSVIDGWRAWLPLA